MLSNILRIDSSPTYKDRSNIINIYQTFKGLLERRNCFTMSSRSTATSSEEPFMTPVSSSGDLLAVSPKRNATAPESNMPDDLLTGSVTMQELPLHDDTFIDAAGFDFLVECAETDRNKNLIDLRKESLFVKFDPLYAKAKLSDVNSIRTESMTDSTNVDVGYETSSATSVFTDNNQYASPIHSLSTSAMHMQSRDKPMQVVSPVVSDVPKSSASQIIRTPALVRSASAILPSPIEVATGRLINLSGEASLKVNSHNHYANYRVKCEESLSTALERRYQEVLQLSLQNRELKSNLQDMEHTNSSKIEKLEMQIKKLSDERDNIMQHLSDKTLSIKQMSLVMEEYEKTISYLIDEQQRDKIKSQGLNEKLINERDQALNHLTSMENTFSDLLAKYEKSKNVLLEGKEREKIYMQKIAEYEAAFNKYEHLYNKLKETTSEKLSEANQTLDKIQKKHDSDVLKMKAAIKKHEITISSLQESLAQKIRDNEGLAKICDEFLS